MLTIEKTVIMTPEQFEIVIEGMRNPLNSWDLSDSRIMESEQFLYFHLGEKDHDLAMRLAENGPVHAKYRRMMPIWVTINAPLYWWKEFDTYKVGTVVNSCSTMHKIQEHEFTMDDFSCEHLMEWDDYENDIKPLQSERTVNYKWVMLDTISALNNARDLYLLSNRDKRFWWQMIQLLPTSYNQKRTIFLNYEVLANIYISRKDHKLEEWRTFCKWIEQLPHSDLITGK